MKVGSKRIELLGANKLKGGTFNGRKINKVIGNVRFKHEGAIMYCDSAYQYLDKNVIDAFGHVKIIKGDSTRLYGKTLNYDGDRRLAKVRGDVKLVNGTRTLTTDFLDYNMAADLADYYEGGIVVDKETTLESVKGTYNLNSEVYSFSDSVSVLRDSYLMRSDTLVYNSISKIAKFFGPTHITSEDKHLFALSGEYHTVSEVSKFKDSAWVETKDQLLKGDSLYYENNKDFGFAKGNVYMLSKEDSLIITGGEGFRNGTTGYAKVYDNPIMRKVDDGDTMYISADTLVAIDDTINNVQNLQAFYHVKLYRDEMQGLCDSMFYSFTDSIIYFFKSPVLWNELNQITADTIRVKMRDGQIDKMYADIGAFLIQEESIGNYNQVKGRNMVATFSNNQINNVDVNGNGESIYFAYNDAQELIGMNKVICSNMLVQFINQELNSISFLKQPDANFIPPQQLGMGDKQLKDFKWLISQRPDKASVMRAHPTAASTTENQDDDEGDIDQAQDKLTRKEKKALREERKQD